MSAPFRSEFEIHNGVDKYVLRVAESEIFSGADRCSIWKAGLRPQLPLHGLYDTGVFGRERFIDVDAEPRLITWIQVPIADFRYAGKHVTG